MLDVGDNVRFRGLGAGKVEEHVTRKFKGEQRVFAVLHFIHNDMRAQVPVGDPAVAEKIEPVLGSSTLVGLLRSMSKGGKVMPRTWDAREEVGQKAIREGGPRQWAELLASYARADGAGVSIAASDEELVRQAVDLLAAELACAQSSSYEEAFEKVESYYDKAVDASRTDEPVEHFSAVPPR